MRISDWSSDVCSSDLVAAPQENMIEHGIDRLPARTKIVGNPPRQRPAIRLRHTAEPEMPQNLRAMPAGGAPGKIIVVHGFGIETKLLRQIQDTVGGYRRKIGRASGRERG